MALNKLECLLGLSSKDKQQIKLQKENLNNKKKRNHVYLLMAQSTFATAIKNYRRKQIIY